MAETRSPFLVPRDWLADALASVATSGVRGRDRRRLEYMVIEASRRPAGAGGGGHLHMFEDLIDKASAVAGKPLSACALQATLQRAGRRDLARRVERLAKARLVIAHPDVALACDVCDWFQATASTCTGSSVVSGCEASSDVDADDEMLLSKDVVGHSDLGEISVVLAQSRMAHVVGECAECQVSKDDAVEVFDLFADEQQDAIVQTDLCLPMHDWAFKVTSSPEEAVAIGLKAVAEVQLALHVDCRLRVAALTAAAVSDDKLSVAVAPRDLLSEIHCPLLFGGDVIAECAVVRCLLDRFRVAANSFTCDGVVVVSDDASGSQLEDRSIEASVEQGKSLSEALLAVAALSAEVQTFVAGRTAYVPRAQLDADFAESDSASDTDPSEPDDFVILDASEQRNFAWAFWRMSVPQRIQLCKDLCIPSRGCGSKQWSRVEPVVRACLATGRLHLRTR